MFLPGLLGSVVQELCPGLSTSAQEGETAVLNAHWEVSERRFFASALVFPGLRVEHGRVGPISREK